MLRALVSLTALCALARAEQVPLAPAEDLARAVAEVTLILSGGEAAHQSLHSLRARGHTQVGAQRVDFVLLATRPDRLRIETPHPDGGLVRASDGVHQPWTRRGEAPPRLLPPGEARDFQLEADFDHPFFNYRKRGLRLEFLGQSEVAGRACLRLKMTDANGEESVLYVDEITRLLTRREIVRRHQGRDHVLATDFADFQVCAGVLLPRRVTTYVDGRLANETVINEVEPNPGLPADTFAPPAENWPLRQQPDRR